MKAIDLTKITSEERLQQVHAKIDELQARLGRELQVIIYSSIHHPEDMFDELADSLRLSVVSFSTGDGGKERYAVKVKAEKLGEIPFALSCAETYQAGESDGGKPALSEHTLAMAALTSAVTNSLSPDQLYGFLASARKQGKISDEQFLLATQQFLTTEEAQA